MPHIPYKSLCLSLVWQNLDATICYNDFTFMRNPWFQESLRLAFFGDKNGIGVANVAVKRVGFQRLTVQRKEFRIWKKPVPANIIINRSLMFASTLQFFLYVVVILIVIFHVFSFAI